MQGKLKETCMKQQIVGYVPKSSEFVLLESNVLEKDKAPVKL